MNLTILASGSKGNGYILHNDSEALIIETGVRFKEAQKALDFKIDKIVGSISSHIHGDHFGFVNTYLDAGIDCYASFYTWHESNIKSHRAKIFHEDKLLCIGNFRIIPFKLFHDVTCHGFLINHNEMGNLFFATDTKQIPYILSSMNHIMIECNYKQDIINHNADIGEIPLFHRNRVMHSHLDLDYVKGFLMDNDLRNVHNIVLLHLSGQNSNPDEMKKEIEQLTHKNVFIASKGLKIELNKEVF